MQNLTVDKDDVKKAYSTANDETKEVLRKLFGDDVFKFDYRKIKTYADACHVLGLPEHIMVNNLGIYGITEFQDIANAMYKLMVICKAMNSDTGYYCDESGWGYSPSLMYYTKEEMDELGEKECKRKGVYKVHNFFLCRL